MNIVQSIRMKKQEKIINYTFKLKNCIEAEINIQTWNFYGYSTTCMSYMKFRLKDLLLNDFAMNIEEVLRIVLYKVIL